MQAEAMRDLASAARTAIEGLQNATSHGTTT